MKAPSFYGVVGIACEIAGIAMRAVGDLPGSTNMYALGCLIVLLGIEARHGS